MFLTGYYTTNCTNFQHGRKVFSALYFYAHCAIVALGEAYEKTTFRYPDSDGYHHYLGVCLYRPKRGHGQNRPLYLPGHPLSPCGAVPVPRIGPVFRGSRLLEGLEKSRPVEIGADLRSGSVRGLQPAADRSCVYGCRKSWILNRYVYCFCAFSGFICGPEAGPQRSFEPSRCRGWPVSAQLYRRQRHQQGRRSAAGLRRGLLRADPAH